MVLEYDTLILTINKRFENGKSFDANICTVIHIVEGYVILAETIGLISFHGSELSYSILSRKKWKKKLYSVWWRFVQVWRSGPLFYLTSIDVRNDSVNEAPMIRRYSKHDLFAMTIC